MNIGAPMIEVMAPTGRFVPSISSLESKSQSMSESDPTKADIGMRKRLSLPNRRFIILGITSPMNPIMPTKETHTAVISEAKMSPENLVSSTLTPRLLATSSPSSIAFSPGARKKKATRLTMTTTPMMPIWPKLARVRSPNVQ